VGLLQGLIAGDQIRQAQELLPLRKALLQAEIEERQLGVARARELQDRLRAAFVPDPVTPAPVQTAPAPVATPVDQTFFGPEDAMQKQMQAFVERYAPRQASSALAPAPQQDEGTVQAVIEPPVPPAPTASRTVTAPGDTTGIQKAIIGYAGQLGLDPALMLSLFETESNFNNLAENPTSKAFSIAQFLPSTAKSRGLDVQRLRTDPVYAAQAGMHYFRELLDETGDTSQALFRYGGAVSPQKKREYTDAVFSKYATNLQRVAALGSAPTQASAPPVAPAPGVRVASAAGNTLADVAGGTSEYERMQQFAQRYNGQQPLQMAPPETAAPAPTALPLPTTGQSSGDVETLRQAGLAHLQYGDARTGFLLLQTAKQQREMAETGLFLRQLLANPSTSPEMRAQAMASLGELLARQGQMEQAMKLVERSLPLSERELLSTVSAGTRDILLAQAQSGQPVSIRTALDEQEAQKAREKQAQDSQVVETADGTFVVDKKTGMATRVTEGRTALTAPAPAGTPPTTGPTGKAIAGKQLTSEQAKAFGFGTRAYAANTIVNQLEDAGTTGSAFWPQMIEKSGKYGREFGGTAGTIIGIVGGGALGGALSGGAGTVPGALVGAGKGAVAGAALGAGYTLMADWFANWLRGPEEQQYAQARLDFITAVLRKESGASISVGEFVTEEKRFFPAPSDSPQVIAQKRQARATALAALSTEAGRPLALPRPPPPMQTPEQAGIVTVPDSGERVKLGRQQFPLMDFPPGLGGSVPTS
jgi:soluble lytic murein transglycosylase-like protein